MNFICSVDSLIPGASSVSPSHCFVFFALTGLQYYSSSSLISIVCSLSPGLPKDILHQITDCLQCTDEDRVVGGHILPCDFTVQVTSSGFIWDSKYMAVACEAASPHVFNLSNSLVFSHLDYCRPWVIPFTQGLLQTVLHIAISSKCCCKITDK